MFFFRLLSNFCIAREADGFSTPRAMERAQEKRCRTEKKLVNGKSGTQSVKFFFRARSQTARKHAEKMHSSRAVRIVRVVLLLDR